MFQALQSSEEARIAYRFSAHLEKMHTQLLNPDTVASFKSHHDILARLLPYHIYAEPEPPEAAVEKGTLMVVIKVLSCSFSPSYLLVEECLKSWVFRGIVCLFFDSFIFASYLVTEWDFLNLCSLWHVVVVGLFLADAVYESVAQVLLSRSRGLKSRFEKIMLKTESEVSLGVYVCACVGFPSFIGMLITRPLHSREVWSKARWGSNWNNCLWKENRKEFKRRTRRRKKLNK